MTPDQIRMLIGGYAAGTLSAEERRILFAAAMEDQTLFDALADEQALKDLLDDPESRGYLREVLEETGAAGAGDVIMMPAQAPAPAPATTVQSEYKTSEAAAFRSQPQKREPARRRYVPAAFGLLAAAGLAIVSVIGIRQLNPAKREAAVETAQVKAPESAPPVDSKPPAVTAPTPAPKAAQAGRAAAAGPKPAAQPATKLAQREDRRDTTGPAPSDAGKRPVDEVTKTPAAEPRKEIPAAATVPPPPPPPPTRTPSPEVAVQTQPAEVKPVQSAPNAALQQPPAPAQNATGVVTETQFRQQNAFGAGAASPARPSTVGSSNAPAAAANPSPKPQLSAPLPVNRAGKDTETALDKAKKAEPPAATYRMLRSDGGTWIPVSSGFRFHAGDEVVIEVDKPRSGTYAFAGTASADGAFQPLPMSIQTGTLARTAPITVRGAMEIVVVISNSSRQPRRIPANALVLRISVPFE